MTPIEQLRTRESPRQIIAEDFASVGELPIHGGWGYTLADACVIDKTDPIVDPGIPFNGVAIEYVFAEKRTFEELIIFRAHGERFAGVRWSLLKQEVINVGGRHFDKLVVEITAFAEDDWDALKAEYESPDGFGHPAFNAAAHARKRQECMHTFQREFWFDISSFFGAPDGLSAG